MLRSLLTSDVVLLVSLAASMSLIGHHVYVVYDGGWWGWLAAIGLAMATMQAILRQHKKVAFGFAGADALYNLAYFGLLAPLAQGAVYPDRANEYLLSLASAGVVAFYAHEYANQGERSTAPAVVFAPPPLRFPDRPWSPPAYLPEPVALVLPTCSFDGCREHAEACPDCGGLRCKIHAGPHKRHRCTTKEKV